MRSILFVSFVRVSGVGGHFYSLCSIAKAMSDNNEVLIVNIGSKPSPIIANSGVPYVFLPFDFINYFDTTKAFKELIVQHKIDVIHSFDSQSYIAAYFAAKKMNIPLVLTKCGGKSVSFKYFPKVQDLIVFSQEDYDYYTSQKYKPEHVALIPNRIPLFNQDKERIEILKRKYHLEGTRVILRIGRFANHYLSTILQSINLAKLLHDQDKSIRLIIIGIIQSQEVYEQVKHEAEQTDFVYIETDSFYTNNAKELLDISDIVVGTGRGFMEACSCNKIMFAPCIKGELPVLVDDANFNEIFKYNFSPRYNPQKGIDELIIDKLPVSNSRKWFEDFFSIDAIPLKYSQFYDNLNPRRRYHTLQLVSRMVEELKRTLMNKYL